MLIKGKARKKCSTDLVQEIHINWQERDVVILELYITIAQFGIQKKYNIGSRLFRKDVLMRCCLLK